MPRNSLLNKNRTKLWFKPPSEKIFQMCGINQSRSEMGEKKTFENFQAGVLNPAQVCSISIHNLPS